MPVFVNLLLVLLLISSAGVGGYLLARAHFTATIANRVMAYQARLARSQRDGKQAFKDVARLEETVAGLHVELADARERVNRYEAALFEGYPASEVDLEAAAAAVNGQAQQHQAATQAAPQKAQPVANEQSLQQQAAAYVQRVQGFDDFDRAGDQDVAPVAQRRGLEQMSRAIA